jgi:hypothetical protein
LKNSIRISTKGVLCPHWATVCVQCLCVWGPACVCIHLPSLFCLCAWVVHLFQISLLNPSLSPVWPPCSLQTASADQSQPLVW